MDNVREKLVELLESINAYAEENLGFDKASGGELIDFHGAEYIADHLLANNVTVQEFGDWAVTKKRKFIEANKAEEQLQKYVLGYGGRVVLNVECSACRKTTMVQETIGLYNYCPHCGAKMLPQPPKGE